MKKGIHPDNPRRVQGHVQRRYVPFAFYRKDK